MNVTSASSRATLPPSDGATLAARLTAVLGSQDAVSVRAFDRVSAAVDASHYLLTPRAVVRPRDASAVAAVMAFAREEEVPLTFRSGGTSLSGQAVTDGLLVDTRRHFHAIQVLDEGLRVRVQPGATLRSVNARLMRYRRKLGPDPASEIACTVGGVVANNSSGMACGVEANSYRTLESLVIVLPSGTVLDTADPDADETLRAVEPELWHTLGALRKALLADGALVSEVRRQYSIKNTMGYGLNSLLDFSLPVQILAHLMVGSEGTLGFVAEATFRSVPLHREAATALLVFDRLQDATEALPALVASGAATIELLDAASLRVVQQDPVAIGSIPDITIRNQAALLVEYQSADAEELRHVSADAAAVFTGLPLMLPAELTSNAAVRANLWHLRKGLYATVAGSRPSGTTALLEDIAVPVAALSRTCAGLKELFERHHYENAVIFGHAKDGNIHFLINEEFDRPELLQRYRDFTEDMVALVLAEGGSLKAEHGTGRIMAPYVRRQFGDRLYAMMLDIKAACDPVGILSPDSVITDDAELHLKHLKMTVTVEEEVDRCVECGYCEPVCPSQDLTTTPRQRIVVRRAIAEAERVGNTRLARELTADSEYAVVETCAVDGMCQTACPVLINTGDLVRRLRAERAGRLTKSGWSAAAKAWGPVTVAASAALSVAGAVPRSMVEAPNRVARRLVGDEKLPLWSVELPGGGRRRSHPTPGHGDVRGVYFQACVNTMFGPHQRGQDGVAAAMFALCERTRVALVAPEQLNNLCCGTPWKSKGMTQGYQTMIAKTLDALWKASRHGELPVICDASSCTEGLVQALETAVSAGDTSWSGLRFVDAVQFVAEQLLTDLVVTRRLGSVVIHPTCSSVRTSSNQHLLTVAAAVAAQVSEPDDWGCCAFAGDRGLLHPELTASATQREAEAVAAQHYDGYASTNRTCELGLTRATGHRYRHILELLEEASA